MTRPNLILLLLSSTPTSHGVTPMFFLSNYFYTSLISTTLITGIREVSCCIANKISLSPSTKQVAPSYVGSFAKFDQSIRLHVEKIFAPPSQAGAQLQSGVSRSEITRDYSRYNIMLPIYYVTVIFCNRYIL